MKSVLRITFRSPEEHNSIKISEIWNQWAACLMWSRLNSNPCEIGLVEKRGCQNEGFRFLLSFNNKNYSLYWFWNGPTQILSSNGKTVFSKIFENYCSIPMKTLDLGFSVKFDFVAFFMEIEQNDKKLQHFKDFRESCFPIGNFHACLSTLRVQPCKARSCVSLF